MNIDNLHDLAERISDELDLYVSVCVVRHRRFKGRPGTINVELSVMDHRNDNEMNWFQKPIDEIEQLEQQVREWLAERVGVAA